MFWLDVLASVVVVVAKAIRSLRNRTAGSLRTAEWTNTCRVRLGMHSVAPYLFVIMQSWVFQPSCCVSSLITVQGEICGNKARSRILFNHEDCFVDKMVRLLLCSAIAEISSQILYRHHSVITWDCAILSQKSMRILSRSSADLFR